MLKTSDYELQAWKISEKIGFNFQIYPNHS
jgi:hypothetical protein